jgi:phosphate transport system substrate-binding protein
MWWMAMSGVVPVGAEHVGGVVRPEVQSQLLPYVPVADVQGSLTVVGSNTMGPLMIRLAGEFMRQYPHVRVMVEAEGTEKALVGFLDGHAASRRGDGNIAGHTASNQIHLMASSRKLTASEIAAFVSRHGYEPTELPIATDAVAIYVHKDSPLKELTLDQVDALFSASQKRGHKASLATWGDVGLNHGAGLSPIRLIGRDRRSGTREFFREHVLLGGEFKELVQEVPGSASVIYEVARDRYAIGYSGIGYQTPLVRTLALADREGAPFVAPNIETASNGSYPLTRPLYLYVNKMPDEPMNPVMLEFLKFINSREGQEAVVSAGVYPLQARRASRNLALLGVGKAPMVVSTTK